MNAPHPILALDVHYDDATSSALAAAVTFQSWSDATPVATYTTRVENVAPYVPGRFFERELPCLTALLSEHQLNPHILVVDGFVHLDANGKPGLGAHLYKALGGAIPVIGVAKTSFAGLSTDCSVLRGDSSRPLYVTAVGVSLDEAKAYVRAMHGKHRMPTLLTAVDHACRGLK
jgi:deoxyribonuclease V